MASFAEHLSEYLKDKTSLAQLKKGIGLKKELKALLLHLYNSSSQTFFLLRRFQVSEGIGKFLVADGSPDGQLFRMLPTTDIPLTAKEGEDQRVVELVCGQDYSYHLSVS